MYGPLRKYILNQIQETFDVEHLGEYYIVDSFNDHKILIEEAKEQNVPPPPVIVYTYKDTELYEPGKLLDTEDIPVVVMNVFMDYGKKDLVC